MIVKICTEVQIYDCPANIRCFVQSSLSHVFTSQSFSKMQIFLCELHHLLRRVKSQNLHYLVFPSVLKSLFIFWKQPLIYLLSVSVFVFFCLCTFSIILILFPSNHTWPSLRCYVISTLLSYEFINSLPILIEHYVNIYQLGNLGEGYMAL